MNGIKPTDLKVFEMISGFIAPKSIGLCDKVMVFKLCRRFSKLIKLVKYLIYFFIVTEILCLNYLFNVKSLIRFTIHLIINIIPLTIYINYIYSLLIFQLLYYYIIVYYLKYKLISINTFIKELTQNNNKRKNNLFLVLVLF